LRDVEWSIRVLATSQARARIERLRVLPPDIGKIAAEMTEVPTGLSALTKEFDPAPGSPDSNLTLRVPNRQWVLVHPRAPLAVVAADLLDSPDARVSRAGRDFLQSWPELMFLAQNASVPWTLIGSSFL